MAQKVVEEDSRYRVTFTYNCEIIKGRDIADLVEKMDGNYSVKNEKV